MFKQIALKYGAVLQDPKRPISQNQGISIMFAGLSGVLVDGLMMGLRLISLKVWYYEDHYLLSKFKCLELYDDISEISEKATFANKNASIFNKHLVQKQNYHLNWLPPVYWRLARANSLLMRDLNLNGRLQRNRLFF